jgi:hypothetical protein
MKQNFDKQEYLKHVNIYSPSSNYLKLYRYGMTTNTVLHQPSNKDGPTFSISLFMPNNSVFKKSYASWTQKYFMTQIKNILVLKYYFPDCNIRIYFDWYMLENGFAKLPGDDISLILTKQVDHLVYNDFEEDKQQHIRDYLNKFYNKLKTYETYPYKNGMERFIHCYQLASIEQVSGNSSSGDFFVYKLSGPFIENEKTSEEGHITNGFIGQQIRYISLRQKAYDWNGVIINRPVHLVWRDAHANGTAYNDYLWIKEMNDFSKNNKTELYLVPTSINYSPLWNDTVKCQVNGKYYTRSAIAGIVQFINSTNSELFLSNDIYNRSIGVTFLLDKNNNLPLINHRHMGYNENQKNYGYGIDEYVNSAFFNLDEIRKKSLYFTHYFANQLFINDSFIIIELLILQYLINSNKISNTISQFEFIKLVEELRNDKSLSTNKELRLLLGIYPTKYHLSACIFSVIDNDSVINFYNKEQIPVNDILSNLRSKISKINSYKVQYTYQITADNLQQLDISCKNTALSSPLEWCSYPYLENQKTDIQSCSVVDFYSGFYYDNPPSLDIGILRQPSDLVFAYNALKNNKLKIPLNKSSYKLKIENNNFMNKIQNNITNYIINKNLEPIILQHKQFYELYKTKSFTYLYTTYPNLFSSLILKALNYVGYDVAPECFKITFNTDNDYRLFNNLVKDLAALQGWAEYTANILMNSSNILNEPNDHSKYKMSMYNKYLKYKQKYLELKKLLN